MKALKTVLGIICFFALVIGVNYIAPDNGIAYAVLIGTAAGGAGVPFLFNLEYVPEFVFWNDAGSAISTFIVETQEDGVMMDMTNLSIAATRGFMFNGALTANDQLVACASGHIPGKRCTIRGTTSAAGAINFFANSDNKDGVLFRLKRLNVLANTPITREKFTALFLPTLATAVDRVEVTFRDSHQQTYDVLELAALSAMYQNTAAQILNNINSAISKATITSAAGGLCYELNYNI